MLDGAGEQMNTNSSWLASETSIEKKTWVKVVLRNSLPWPIAF